MPVFLKSVSLDFKSIVEFEITLQVHDESLMV